MNKINGKQNLSHKNEYKEGPFIIFMSSSKRT